MSVANEVQAWHATSLPADSPTPKRKRRGHAHKNTNSNKILQNFIAAVQANFTTFALIIYIENVTKF